MKKIYQFFIYAGILSGLIGGLSSLLLPRFLSNEVIVMLLMTMLFQMAPSLAYLGVKKKVTTRLNFQLRLDRWLVLSIIVPTLIMFATGAILGILGQPYQSSIFLQDNIYLIAILTTIIGSVGEEIGWRGFVQVEAAKELGPFKSSLVTGILWGLWHVPKIWQGGFLSYLIFTISIIVMSIIMGYIFHQSNRSLPNMIAYHSMNNILMMFLLYERESMEFYVVNISLSLLVVLVLFIRDRSYFRENECV